MKRPPQRPGPPRREKSGPSGPQPRHRRTLSTPRGEIRIRGDERAGGLLQAALEAGTDPQWRVLTHGFHAYPARMHPYIARTLIRELAPPGTPILDPFCGSGTTLVEAMTAGLLGYGCDLHPLAVRLTRVKCSLWNEEDRRNLLETGRVIGEMAHELARDRESAKGARRNPALTQYFAPHVRYEVANLLALVESVEWSRARDALELVVSSLLVKVSNLSSDSNPTLGHKALPRGRTGQLFAGRTAELVQSLTELYESAPREAQPPRVRRHDARQIRGLEPESIPLVVTSPPYLGVYNYASHQEMRLQVMGMADEDHSRGEIGARGRAGGSAPSLGEWKRDLNAVLIKLAEAMPPGGDALFMMGSSRVNGRIIPNHEILVEVGDVAGFDPLASASQDRPDFSPRDPGEPDRGRGALPEHLVWLRRTTRQPRRLAWAPPPSKTDRPQSGPAKKGPRGPEGRSSGPADPRRSGPPKSKSGPPAPPKARPAGSAEADPPPEATEPRKAKAPAKRKRKAKTKASGKRRPANKKGKAPKK